MCYTPSRIWCLSNGWFRFREKYGKRRMDTYFPRRFRYHCRGLLLCLWPENLTKPLSYRIIVLFWRRILHEYLESSGEAVRALCHSECDAYFHPALCNRSGHLAPESDFLRPVSVVESRSCVTRADLAPGYLAHVPAGRRRKFAGSAGLRSCDSFLLQLDRRAA